MTEREQERAAVVRWLRDVANDNRRRATEYGGRGIYHVAASYSLAADARRELADAIERGDHIGKE